MAVHRLKTWQKYFAAIESGEKTFDIRLEDNKRFEPAKTVIRSKAPIVCICGSYRFKQALISEEARLAMEGNIVLGLDIWGQHERRDPSPEVKAMLDELQRRKIDLADWIWIVDVGGYIGNSTMEDIEYALANGKPVRYLSLEFPGYVEPVDDLAVQLEKNKAETAAIIMAANEMLLCMDPSNIDGAAEYVQSKQDEAVERYRRTVSNPTTAGQALIEQMQQYGAVVEAAVKRKRLTSEFRANEKELRDGWTERMMIMAQELGRADDVLDASLEGLKA